jgi:hypothetical protein
MIVSYHGKYAWLAMPKEISYKGSQMATAVEIAMNNKRKYSLPFLVLNTQTFCFVAFRLKSIYVCIKFSFFKWRRCWKECVFSFLFNLSIRINRSIDLLHLAFFSRFSFFSLIRCFISLRTSEGSRNDCLCTPAHTNLILSWCLNYLRRTQVSWGGYSSMPLQL